MWTGLGLAAVVVGVSLGGWLPLDFAFKCGSLALDFAFKHRRVASLSLVSSSGVVATAASSC